MANPARSGPEDLQANRQEAKPAKAAPAMADFHQRWAVPSKAATFICQKGAARANFGQEVVKFRRRWQGRAKNGLNLLGIPLSKAL